LGQHPGLPRAHVGVDGSEGLQEDSGLAAHRFKGGQAQRSGGQLLDAAERHRAADIAQRADRLPGAQPGSDFADRRLAHAVHQQVRLGVQEHRAAHLVVPVVVMRQAAQAGFDAAQDQG